MQQLKPVINFSKQHVFELACGGVVVAALAGSWWFFPDTTEGVKKRAGERLGVATSLDNASKATPSLEGVVYYDHGVKSTKWPAITATPALTKLKDAANRLMEKEHDDINRVAGILNRQGRVDDKGRPLFDGKVVEIDDHLEAYDPKLTPESEKGRGFPITYLPRNGVHSSPARTFKFLDDHYTPFFESLHKRLTGRPDDRNVPIDPRLGTVPTLVELEARWKEFEATEVAKVSSAFGPKKLDAKAHNDFVKQAVTAAALSTPIYVDPSTAFFRRSMGGGTKAPLFTEVYEAYVDSWIQRDVVASIVSTNVITPLAAPPRAGQPRVVPQPEPSRVVATSPIKRFIGISVGAGAATAFGGASAPGGAGTGLYLRSIEAVPAGAPGAPAPARPANPAAAAAAAGTDPGYSMTGRIGNNEFHVVPVYVSFVCEPSAVNKFIDELYKRNNGYTVINRRDTVVDPYTAAASGFLYGDAQCVQVDLLVECLLFRDWVDKITPAGYTGGAGGVAVPAGPGGGQGDFDPNGF